MPNIGTAFKAEIIRVARKEIRSEIAALKKTSAQQRSHIAALKRTIQSLQQQVSRIGKTATKVTEQAAAEDNPKSHRFSAKSLISQRRRLSLSAREVGALIGVSALTIYNWESGKTRPRPKQLEGISTLRNMGKKDAAARLAQIDQ